MGPEGVRVTRILISLFLAGLVLGGVFFAGYRDGVAQCEATANRDKLKAVARAIKQAEAIAAADAEVSAAYEQTRVVRETRYLETERIVRHEIEKPVYRACRLDACGLCLAAAAARDSAATDCPCEPDYALSADPAGTPRRLDGGAAGSLPGIGADVPRLPEPASGAGAGGER